MLDRCVIPAQTDAMYHSRAVAEFRPRADAVPGERHSCIRESCVVPLARVRPTCIGHKNLATESVVRQWFSSMCMSLTRIKSVWYKASYQPTRVRLVQGKLSAPERSQLTDNAADNARLRASFRTQASNVGSHKTWSLLLLVLDRQVSATSWCSTMLHLGGCRYGARYEFP